MAPLSSIQDVAKGKERLSLLVGHSLLSVSMLSSLPIHLALGHSDSFPNWATVKTNNSGKRSLYHFKILFLCLLDKYWEVELLNQTLTFWIFSVLCSTENQFTFPPVYRRWRWAPSLHCPSSIFPLPLANNPSQRCEVIPQCHLSCTFLMRMSIFHYHSMYLMDICMSSLLNSLFNPLSIG